MKPKFLYIFLILFYTQLSATDNICPLCDSLLVKPSLTEKEFEQLNKMLFNLNYYESNNPVTLFRRAISQAIGSDQPKHAGILSRWFADMYYELGSLDTAGYYAENAADYLRQSEDELEYARTANVRRLLSTLKTDFSDAYAISFEALDIFEKHQDEVGKAITYRDIGSVKLQEEKYEEALDYCLRAVNPLVNGQNWYELTFTYQRIAIIYRNLGKFDLAHEAIQKAMHACRQLTGFRVNQGLLKNYWTRGYIYEASKDYDLAIAYYDSSKYFAELVNYDLVDKWILNSKGEIYLKQKNYLLALEQFNKAMDFISSHEMEQNSYDYFVPIYANLVKTYEGLGDYKMAHSMLKKVSSAKDSIFQLKSEKQVTELQTKYETAQKEATISELQKDKVVQQKFLLLGSIMLALLLLVAFILWRNNRFRSRMNDTLKKQKDEIEAKSNQNELLLKEIHHRVKNNLEIVSGLLTLQGAQVTDPDARAVMVASNNRVQAMGILHQKLYQGANLGAVEMKNYFMNLSEGILDSFDLDDRVKIELAMDNLELDLDTAVPIGLIVNELLTNALKYAFPEESQGKICIKLEEVDQDNLMLEVADNGIGADLNASSKGTGFGSQLVHLLTQQLRGSISQQVDNGTIISLILKKSKAA